ncbi:FAD-binding oxidoreductase [Desulfogranum japonicum]|uniref:FAD-binding oxidoreductase n=1 Tax=Desulfogranum japonicum TaxID=231447 RepID=UPI00041E61FC|nr:FAD-linked oxidase C-terminal domain-containing protein [Desulfogranum japonicum]
MLNKDLLLSLERIVGPENVLTEQSDRLIHGYDATQKQYMPDVVVYVENSLQVSEIVKLANQYNIPILPRGAGSGFTGGSLPVQGGIVVVLTRMNAILDIDEDNLTATVEPGVVTAHLQREVEKSGLFYPPDPASKEFSTIGGNVAECAGGPRCVKYGVTKDYILGLEVVTPTGDILHTGGVTMKNVAGYDLTKLFVGSEGTLGIVTRITVKLLPKPAAKKTMLVQFSSIDSAARAVSTIIRNKIIPTTLEFLDATTIECIRGKTGLPVLEKCRALLIIEVDGDQEILEKQTDKILGLLTPLGILESRVAADHTEAEAIWDVRRSVSPSMRKINPDKFNEDIVVPRSKVPDMIRALEKISSTYDVPIVNFGHAGDGNIHVNVMVDLQQPGMQATVDKVLLEIFQTTVDMGGSISGEHGIGTAKAPFLRLEIDPATLHYMQMLKKALDPNNIMNPGKIFLETSPEQLAFPTQLQDDPQ